MFAALPRVREPARAAEARVPRLQLPQDPGQVAVPDVGAAAGLEAPRAGAVPRERCGEMRGQIVCVEEPGPEDPTWGCEPWDGLRLCFCGNVYRAR